MNGSVGVTGRGPIPIEGCQWPGLTGKVTCLVGGGRANGVGGLLLISETVCCRRGWGRPPGVSGETKVDEPELGDGDILLGHPFGNGGITGAGGAMLVLIWGEGWPVGWNPSGNTGAAGRGGHALDGSVAGYPA